jgi:hypothetical protein
VYEHLANQAQRRVRTCLENIIPRDIIEAACEECDKTLKTTTDVTPEGIAKLVAAFEKLNVTKDQIEARIQRRIDTISPAQAVHLAKICRSIRDGVAKPNDFFSPTETSKSASGMDQAKAALKKRAEKPPAASTVPQQSPPAPPTPETTLDRTEPQQPASDDLQMGAEMWVAEERDMIAEAAGLDALIVLRGHIDAACKAGIITALQRDRSSRRSRRKKRPSSSQPSEGPGARGILRRSPRPPNGR